jgi:hypothetical protein
LSEPREVQGVFSSIAEKRDFDLDNLPIASDHCPQLLVNTSVLLLLLLLCRRTCPNV